MENRDRGAHGTNVNYHANHPATSSFLTFKINASIQQNDTVIHVCALFYEPCQNKTLLLIRQSIDWIDGWIDESPNWHSNGQFTADSRCQWPYLKRVKSQQSSPGGGSCFCSLSAGCQNDEFKFNRKYLYGSANSMLPHVVKMLLRWCFLCKMNTETSSDHDPRDHV